MLSGRTVGIFNAYLFYLKSMFYVSMMLDVRFALHRHGKSGEGRQGNVAPSNHTSKPIGKSKICRKLQPDHKNEQSKRSVSSLTPYIDARHMRNRNKDRQRAGALSVRVHVCNMRLCPYQKNPKTMAERSFVQRQGRQYATSLQTTQGICMYCSPLPTYTYTEHNATHRQQQPRETPLCGRFPLTHPLLPSPFPVPAR